MLSNNQNKAQRSSIHSWKGRKQANISQNSKKPDQLGGNAILVHITTISIVGNILHWRNAVSGSTALARWQNKTVCVGKLLRRAMIRTHHDNVILVRHNADLNVFSLLNIMRAICVLLEGHGLSWLLRIRHYASHNLGFLFNSHKLVSISG